MKANSMLPDPKTVKGSVVYILLLSVVMMILHYDFWNWGAQQWTFLAWNQEILYRFAFLVVLTPIANYILVKYLWPVPDDAGWLNND